MDRPIDPVVRRNKIMKRVYTAAGITVSALILLFWGFNHLRPSVKRSKINTSIVERGAVLETVSASGMIIPEIEYVVTSQVSSTILKILRSPGDILEYGDSLIVLDMKAHILAKERLEEQILLKENQKEQISVDLSIQLNDLESQRDQRKLRYEVVKSTHQQQKKMFDMGGLSRKDINESELSVEIARIELDQIESAIENAHTLERNRLSGIILEQNILEKEREELTQTIDQARTIIDHGGVLTWIVEDVGASVGVGELIARIADLQSYCVQATISEVHATKLTTGLPVIVKLADDTRLNGHIQSIQPTIENGIITFTAALENSADTHLRSNLRAQINLVTSEKRDVLRIKQGPFAQGYGISDVFVIHADRALKREITFGIAGVDWIEILDGLHEGDEVIISDMRERLYANELRLR